jgi:hypothetical protein
MRARRYTVLIADRSSGVVRRVGISLRPAIVVAVGILSIPVLIGLGAKWSAGAEIGQLQSANSLLEVENGNYRQATGELTGQIPVARGRHQRPGRARHPRSRAGAGDSEASCRRNPVRWA